MPGELHQADPSSWAVVEGEGILQWLSRELKGVVGKMLHATY